MAENDDISQKQIDRTYIYFDRQNPQVKNSILHIFIEERRDSGKSVVNFENITTLKDLSNRYSSALYSGSDEERELQLIKDISKAVNKFNKMDDIENEPRYSHQIRYIKLPGSEIQTNKLPKTKQGEFNYYGQPEFVDRIINAWKAKNVSNRQSKLSGVYGTVYKVANNVNVDRTQYYVKQIAPIKSSLDFLGNMNKAIQEIEISNILTGLVPDSVSNLKGARVLSEELIDQANKRGEKIKGEYELKQIIDPELAYSYLIFEGPEGMTVDTAFRLIGDSGKSNEERLKDYLDIVCSAKAAIDSVNSLGYSHNDAHGNNMFLTGNGANVKCKLIDFGEATAMPPTTAAATAVAAEPLLGGGSSTEAGRQKYSSDIKHMVFKTIGSILIFKDMETIQFRRYLSIQLPSDIYQYEDTELMKLIKTDKVIDEIFNLCGRTDFIKYRIINNYVNEAAANQPLIPLESGPHLPTKPWFSRGGYKKKTRRKNKGKKKSRRN